jgi:hypothetical protein
VARACKPVIILPCLYRPDFHLDKPTAQQRTETALPLIHVVASVNLTKARGKINFAHPLSQGEVSGIERDSTVILRVKRVDEQVLHEYPVGVKLLFKEQNRCKFA